MNASSLMARRFFWIALVFFLPLGLFSGWLASHVSPEPSWLNALAPMKPMLPYAGVFMGLVLALVFRGIAGFFLARPPVVLEKKGPTREKGKAGSPMAEDAEAKKARDQKLFLYLLATLQKDARLLDFFSEDLEMYEDEQIGAAVRPVHENARKTLARYLDMAPVREEEEGSRMTVPQGFDPNRIKLIGKVAGDPPFQGILRHRGWRAKGIRMPVLSEAKGADVLTPSEVEII